MENVTSLSPSDVLKSKDGECKGCSASVHVSDERILRLVEQLSEQQDMVLATDLEYANRVKACQTCDSLQFGTTCRWCGCLVAVKAKKLESTCPHPRERRW